MGSLLKISQLKNFIAEEMTKFNNGFDDLDMECRASNSEANAYYEQGRINALLEVKKILENQSASKFVITSEDIGRAILRRDGVTIYLSGCMGRVLPCDVGKIVYVAEDGFVSVEDNEQRDERIAKGGN